MTDPILVTRNIALSSICLIQQMPGLMSFLEQSPGIKAAAYDSEDNKISIEYDQLQLNYTDLLAMLSAQGISCKKGVSFKIRAGWYEYLDTTARENASAPPPACCNKPPKR